MNDTAPPRCPKCRETEVTRLTAELSQERALKEHAESGRQSLALKADSLDEALASAHRDIESAEARLSSLTTQIEALAQTFRDYAALLRSDMERLRADDYATRRSFQNDIDRAEADANRIAALTKGPA